MRAPSYIKVSGPRFKKNDDGTFRAYYCIGVKRWGAFVLLWTALKDFEFCWHEWPRAILVYLRMCIKIMLFGWNGVSEAEE